MLQHKNTITSQSYPEKGTLPFLYEDTRNKAFYLKCTQELVVNTDNFNNYYENYKKVIHSEKFTNTNLKTSYELPILPNLEGFMSTKYDTGAKTNESINIKDSVNSLIIKIRSIRQN